MTPQEAKTVLKSLIARIDKQPRRPSAEPSLHLLRVRQRIFVPTCGGNGGWWVDTSNSTLDPIAARTSAQATDALSEKYNMDIAQDYLAECDLIEWWETRNVFLTEEGLKRHLELNSHNIEEEFQDFQIHAFRNPEIEDMLAAIRALIVD